MVWRLLVFSVLTFSCAQNIFAPFANKVTDEALLYQAELDINSRDYDTAVDRIQQMTPSGQAQREAQILLATAYSGQCGFEFFRFFSNLSSADFSAASLFLISMQAFKQVNIVPPSCGLAEALLSELNTSGTPLSNDQQLFSVILSFAKMGVFLRNRADVDSTSFNGDGIVDVGWDACDDTKMSDNDVAEVLLGLARFITSASLLGSALGSADFDSSVGSLSALCSDPALTGSGNFCDVTTVAAALPFVPIVRILLQWRTTGIGSCFAADAGQAVLNCCP